MATSVLRTLAVRLSLNSAAFRKDVKQVRRTTNRMAKGMQADAKRVNAAMSGIVGAFGLLYTGRAILGAADQMQNLRNKLSALHDTSDGVSKSMKNITIIAKNSRAEIDAVGTLYQRLTVASRHLGVSQKAVSDATEVVMKTFIISGTTGSEAANSARQFAQGIASGALRGDEFRSVSENNVELTRILADGFNVTTGQLRLMSQEGYLTASRIMPILQESLEKTNDKIEKMPLTIDQARIGFANSFKLMVDRLNQTYKITQTAARGFAWLTDNLHIVSGVVVALSGIIAGVLMKSLVNWLIVTLAQAAAMVFGKNGLIMAVFNLGHALVTYLYVGAKQAAKGFKILFTSMKVAKFAALGMGIGIIVKAIQMLNDKFNFMEGIFDWLNETFWPNLMGVFKTGGLIFKQLALHLQDAMDSVLKSVNWVMKKLGQNPIFVIDAEGNKKQIAEVKQELQDLLDKKNAGFTPDDFFTAEGGLGSKIKSMISSTVDVTKDAIDDVVDFTGMNTEEGVFATMLSQAEDLYEFIKEKNPELAKLMSVIQAKSPGEEEKETEKDDMDDNTNLQNVSAVELAASKSGDGGIGTQGVLGKIASAGFKDFLESLPEKMILLREALETLEPVFDNLQDKVSTTFADALLGITNLADGFRALGQEILHGAVRAIVKFATQWIASRIAMAIAERVVNKQAEAAKFGATAAQKTNMELLAAATVPAAVMTTLAMAGTNFIPAAAAMTGMGLLGIATHKAVGAAAQAHDGYDNLPKTGTYLLEKGERVVGNSLNKDLSDFLSQSQAMGTDGGSGLTLNVNGVSDPDIVIEALSSRSGELESLVRQIAADGAQNSPL